MKFVFTPTPWARGVSNHQGTHAGAGKSMHAGEHARKLAEHARSRASRRQSTHGSMEGVQPGEATRSNSHSREQDVGARNARWPRRGAVRLYRYTCSARSKRCVRVQDAPNGAEQRPHLPLLICQNFQKALADSQARAGVAGCWCSRPCTVRSQRCGRVHAVPARRGAVPSDPRQLLVQE